MILTEKLPETQNGEENQVNGGVAAGGAARGGVAAASLEEEEEEGEDCSEEGFASTILGKDNQKDTYRQMWPLGTIVQVC